MKCGANIDWYVHILHTHTHTHTHTHMHAHIHAHTYTHTHYTDITGSVLQVDVGSCSNICNGRESTNSSKVSGIEF